MLRTLRLAFSHRRDPLAYGRSVSGLVIRYLRSRAVDPAGRRWLDVGTGAGTLPEALELADACVVALDVEDRRADGVGRSSFVVGSGVHLPFTSGSFDGLSCSNVLEHVRDHRALITELLRVIRPGGVVYLSWTNWYSPFGGHEWSPFHYLGQRIGPRVYRALTGRPPRNVPGQTLFAVHVGDVLAALRESPVRVLDVAPRYWPSMRWIARVPVAREFLMWNCVILLRAGGPSSSRPVENANLTR
jgi:SAM-dependent methyltransferase